MRRFGFGQTLGRDFRGQSPGIVLGRASIDDSALASMAMGYQVSVTPLQMAAATSAVANGGVLYEPHVVRAIVRNGVREAVAPKAIGRAISAETAATLTTFMEAVVHYGTGVAAGLERYQVAGKTGTSNKAIPGGYSKTDFNASFVGFVPSRRPAFTILVVIDTPRAGKHFGGDVAAPIFKRIADAALAQTGVPPTIRPLPPILVNVNADTASAAAHPARAMQLPVVTPLGGRTLMPDVRGLSAREALRILGAAGLTTQLSGDGFVVAQSPAPGEAIEPGARSVLQLRRSLADARGPGGGSR
jgi:stage V sporulation protein D (sporulation-specific penicillin-binding protein)